MRSRSEGRPISDEADARACLAAMTASGTTLFAWARANGVASAHLYRWRQLVAGHDGPGIEDEADARDLLASWARSGRSFAEWCRGAGVSMEALRRWRRRIEAPRVVVEEGVQPGPAGSTSSLGVGQERPLQHVGLPDLVGKPASKRSRSSLGGFRGRREERSWARSARQYIGLYEEALHAPELTRM